jgi:hypothetical protein
MVSFADIILEEVERIRMATIREGLGRLGSAIELEAEFNQWLADWLQSFGVVEYEYFVKHFMDPELGLRTDFLFEVGPHHAAATAWRKANS